MFEGELEAAVEAYINVMQEAAAALHKKREIIDLRDFQEVCHALRDNAIGRVSDLLKNEPERIGGLDGAKQVLNGILAALGPPGHASTRMPIMRH